MMAGPLTLSRSLAPIRSVSRNDPEGTSRNRAVWYWPATLPRPVRHGDPAGAAHEDIGQSLASTLRKSSALPPRSVSTVHQYGTTYETDDAVRRLRVVLFHR